jgi:hypothetical protein
MSVETFDSMIGKVMTSVVADRGNDVMTFTSECGKTFRFLHHQDCCESVVIEDVCGDVDDLVGSPILQAEEVSNADAPVLEGYESYTWTFYKYATAKGSVTVRWLGSSNGYYGEGVSYEESKS